MLQTNITGVCLQYLFHAGLAPTSGAHRSSSMLLRWGTVGPRLHAPPGSKMLRLGADLVGPAFCALPRSEQLRSWASAVAATYGLSLLLRFLGVPLASLLRRVMTVQSPQKS